MIGKQFIDLFFRVETKEAQKDIDNVGDGLDNIGKKGRIASGGLKLIGNGFKFIGGAIKAAGIGLLVGLLAQLTGVFQSNQKVADTFGRVMIKLKPIFDVIGDVLAFVVGLLETLIDLFSGAINFIGNLIGVTDGYASSTADLADEIVRLRNEQKLMNAELELTKLQYQREAELQRQIRDDTSKTMEERIEANEQLGKILQEQFEEEREMALVGLDLAQKELELEQDNIDLKVAVIEAKTRLAEIDERITGQRSEQLVNLTSLEQERADKQKEHSERIQKQLEEEEEAFDDLIKKIKQHVEIVEEELSLTEKLNEAEENFKAAKEELTTLRNEEAEIIRKQLANNNKFTQEGLDEAKRIYEKNREDIIALNEEYNKQFDEDNEEASKVTAMQLQADLDFLLEETNKSFLAYQDYEKNLNRETKENTELRLKLNNDAIETERKIKEAETAFNEAQANLLKVNAAAVTEFMKTEQEKEVDAVTKKYDDIIARTIEGSGNEIKLTEEKRIAIQEINDRYDEEARQKTRNFLQMQFDLVKTINQKEIDAEKHKDQVKEQLLQKAIGISTKGSALYKALAIANTIISTRKGVMQAFGDETLPFPLKLASALLIGAEGVKSINEIRKTKIPGESGGGGNGNLSDLVSLREDVSGDVPTLPGGALGDSDSPPLQAYVVESDISDAQALQNDIDIQATL